MKKVLSIILCTSLFCTAFVGCSNNSDVSLNKNTTQYTTADKETKLVPDDAATGELTISCFNEDNSLTDGYDYGDQITAASKKFKELYPNVTLTVERGFNGEDFLDYYKQMSTQIMAGDGPDVFFVNETIFDINKVMRSGTLADLYEYFENDQNFNINDYNKSVFYGGQPSGKQYIVPVSYEIPILLTTEDVAKKSGFNISNCKDYLSCLKEVDAVIQKGNIADINSVWHTANSSTIYFPKYSGIERMNYDTAKSNLDTPELKSIYEILKRHFKEYTSQETTFDFNADNFTLDFKDEKRLFVDFTVFPFSSVINTFLTVGASGQKPIMFTLRNVNEKITATISEAVAVRNNSSNKQNAYNFIKILINPQTQAIDTYSPRGIPISNVSALTIIQRDIEKYKANSYINSDIDFSLIEKALPEKYMAILSDIEGVDYFSEGDFVLRSEMVDYLDDKKSYEECIAKAKSALDLYLSE